MFPAIEMKGVPIAVNDASRHFRNKSPLVAAFTDLRVPAGRRVTRTKCRRKVPDITS